MNTYTNTSIIMLPQMLTWIISSSEARQGETESSNNYSERLTERKPVRSKATIERIGVGYYQSKSRRSNEAKRNEVDEI